MSAEVSLWWIGADAADGALMDVLRRQVEAAFHLRARHYHHADRPTHAFDPRRGQHSSTQILKWLVERAAPAGRVLAVTDVDLFIPVLTYVYGEAQLGGRCAVVSTARLGLDPEALITPGLVAERAVKETVHELGHTFGLLHCDAPTCVMGRSVSLVDVDRKSATLCRGCEALYGELRRKEGHHE
jgi:archaemetzincin